MEINEDGSIKGELFTKSDVPYPHPKRGRETLSEYHTRVNELAEQGFHKGDLSWPDYTLWCMGSGQYEGANENAIIH